MPEFQEIWLNNGCVFCCKVPHTASADKEPGVGTAWETYWDLWVISGTNGSDGTSGTSGTTPDSVAYATSAGYSGTALIALSGGSTSGSSGTVAYATSSGESGTAGFAQSAGYAGTALIAIIGGATSGTSGTVSFATTSGTALYATSAGNAGTAYYSTSAGQSGTAYFATAIGSDGTFNSLRVTGNQTSGTTGYLVNTYWGTAATMGTVGIPLGSIYIQTGTASSSDYAGTAAKATSAGYAGTSGTAPLGVLPYGNFSSLTSQFATAATVAYPVILEYDDVKNGLTHSTAGTASADVQIDIAGTYLITFSAVAKTDTPNDTLDIWLRVNGVDVPRSNTVSKFVGTGNERIVTAIYIYTFTAGQKFTLMYWGNAGGVQMVATGTAGTPARPASPSIIVTVNKISD